MNTDPIADLLTRIRNASLVNKITVLVPYSKFKEQIVQVLVKEKFVVELVVDGTGVNKNLVLTLLGNKRISLDRISKAGQRIYTPANELHKVKNGYGISILSTSSGIMTGKEAFNKKIGGEIICEVY